MNHVDLLSRNDGMNSLETSVAKLWSVSFVAAGISTVCVWGASVMH